MRIPGILTIALLCGSCDFDIDASGRNNGSTRREILYVATGEYSPASEWDAILRFDPAQDINSDVGGPEIPQGIVPIKQCYDRNGIRLNFGHGIYLDERHDEMFIGSLFTNDQNSGVGGVAIQSGSIGVLAYASTANGPQVLARHIYGPQTGINQPHGLWLDGSRDLLYVANSFAGNLLVFRPARTVDGDVPPDRIISHPSLGDPIHVFIEPVEDRLFVAVKPPTGVPMSAAVAMYNRASTLDGNVQPDLRIAGPSTRLDIGNPTTHNVWFDLTTRLLFVGHHTNEVLIFDLATIDLDPPTPVVLDLAPRVLKINEDPADADASDWSCYGLFYLASLDRLYVSCGFTPMGPLAGSPPNEIKIFDRVSDPSVSGLFPPSRTLHWTVGDTYYPPQPIWVTY
jgi:hypothetical protein